MMMKHRLHEQINAFVLGFSGGLGTVQDVVGNGNLRNSIESTTGESEIQMCLL